MKRICVLLLGLTGVGGCGGHYVLTVPDQVAPAGGEAATVVRLQRNDFFVLTPAVNDAAMRLQIAGGKERGAYTDKLGYAGTTVPVPQEPGRYRLRVSHLDLWGDEATADAPAYVWAADRPVIAVDLDCLPGLLLGSPKEGARALQRLAAGADLVYMTRRDSQEHAGLHRFLAKRGYPDGPILTWHRQRWHVVREGRLNLPRIVVESRLVSQITELRKDFPDLKLGVGDSDIAAKAFAEAGMEVLMVGKAAADVKTLVHRRDSWTDLADRGP